jgi:alpha-glucosidase (family GH31 glycosyl hydrolase)
MIPLATNLDDRKPTYPNSFSYRLGADVFVAPMMNNDTLREVTFPTGADWVDYFTNVTYRENSTHQLQVPFDRYPAFKRAGAVIPMHVQSDNSLHGDISSLDALTLLVQSPLHTADGEVTEVGGLGTAVRVVREFSGVRTV